MKPHPHETERSAPSPRPAARESGVLIFQVAPPREKETGVSIFQISESGEARTGLFPTPSPRPRTDPLDIDIINISD